MNAFREMKEEIIDFFNSNLALKIFKWITVVLFPFYLTIVTNYLSFGTSDQMYALITANTGSFVYGLLLVCLVYLFFIAIVPKLAMASFLTALICMILSLVDFFKFSILKEHFLPWDIYLAQNASSFTEFLGSIVIPQGVWEILCGTLFYCILLYFMAPSIPMKWKFRAPISPIFLIGLCLFVTNDTVHQIYTPVFGITIGQSTKQSELYGEHGFLTAFALNFGSLNMGQPQNYSKGYIQHAFEKYLPQENSGETFQNPDIVVVLSEAYWDPTVLNGVSFSADPLENFRKIAETNPSGKMISPTFGGGTVRPEFEILTGMSTSALPPGNIPYQQYLKGEIFSFPRTYKNLGYDAIGIHTYQKTFYDRNKAYPLMGFDDFLGEYDLNVEHHWNSGPYITDETIAEEIIYQLEQPHDVGTFVMAITMENHSMYHDKYDEQDRVIKVTGENLTPQQVLTLENYAAGVRNSDLALKSIYDYIMSREKPTVVLWYGDHLPTLGDDFDPYTSTNTITSSTAAQWTEDEKYTMFSTPYLIFTNYNTGKEYLANDEECISPYLLPALMADYIDAPESIQTNFLLDLYRTCPVMSKYYNLFSPDKNQSKRDEMQKLHELMTYDMLIGKNYISEVK
ncbi:LTA synthase family protein [Anaerotignum sp. MB30-C6]|uniref:LTA synthase family protein n=1 Tax=Anaerotignum sp. MB30-C6 TaxID=3070814 RepID=UPI0027DE11BB|nr:alkaline phosphatase family protein [Anaerotignum sp. MB30-C6]WMI81640.1 sulfatase-like hydrolase/transferase [Anaerotignum sp. MB30-C6]